MFGSSGPFSCHNPLTRRTKPTPGRCENMGFDSTRQAISLFVVNSSRNNLVLDRVLLLALISCCGMHCPRHNTGQWRQYHEHPQGPQPRDCKSA